MRHFYFKAVKEQERGAKADQIAVGAAFNQAATLAEKVAPYRHPRLAAMKLAGDPNALGVRDDITIEELRAEIMAKVRGLRMFEDMAQLPPPEGVVHNGSNGRGEASRRQRSRPG